MVGKSFILACHEVTSTESTLIKMLLVILTIKDNAEFWLNMRCLYMLIEGSIQELFVSGLSQSRN